MILYTLGHSTSDLERFVSVLVDAGVDLVVDVRSKPRSRLAHFDQGPLSYALEKAGIAYRYLGDRLGGMPRDPRLRVLWQQGRLDERIVAALRETEEWQDGISELAELLTRRPDRSLCLLCSERDPDECHRKAVALDLASVVPGLEVVHLAVDSRVPQEVGLQQALM